MSIFCFHFLNKCTKYSSCFLPDSWHRIQKIKYLCRASDSALGLVQGSCQNPSVFHFAFTDTGTLKVSLARWSSGWDKRYISKEVLKHELMWEGSQVLRTVTIWVGGKNSLWLPLVSFSYCWASSTDITSSWRSQENRDTCNPRFCGTKNWSPKKKVEVHWLGVTQAPILFKLIIIQVRPPPPPPPLPVRPPQPQPAWSQPQLQNPTWLSSTTGWTFFSQTELSCH